MLAKQPGIHQRTVALDTRQHRHQRHLDVLEHLAQAWRGLQLLPQRLVQAQGHVGIFCRIGPGLFQGDLVEGQLLGTLAGNVLEADGAVRQVLLRQAVHIVTGRRGVEHIGFEHGVESHALHLDRRGRVGQYIDVVLGVLADLGLGRVFENRLERAQHGVAVQLRRHAHVGVGQRHVGGLARLDGEGHADHLGLLRIETGGLGVEGDQLGGFQLFQPGVEARLLQHRLVARFAGRCHGALSRSRLGRIEQATARRRHRGRTGLGLLALQLVEPALEFQLAIQGDQRRTVRLAGMQVVDADVQFDIGLDGRQLVGEEGHLLVLGELGRQGLGAADRQLGDLVQAGVEHVEAAADADQQAQRGLLADTRHTGDVVDLVAHQGQVVDDQLGADAEFLAHTRDVVDAASHGVDQGDMRADQLGHVLVAGGNHHVTAQRGGLPGQGADHVVGLHTFHAQQRVTEGAYSGMQRLDLAAQLLGHRRAMRLVVLEHRVAEGRTLGVEHHGEGAVRVLLAQALEHVQHALHRAGLQALGVGQWRQGVEGAVQVGGAVDQNKRSVGHAKNQPIGRGLALESAYQPQKGTRLPCAHSTA